MKKSRGFTLIELMVVVAIIAILARIALPLYFNQVRKARRSEVEGAMQQLALAQERFRADCTTYATAFSFACPAGSAATFPTLASLYTSSFYTLAIDAANTNATQYRMTAAPVGTQANDSASGSSCGTLTFDFGVTTAGSITKTTSTGNTNCWSSK